MSNKITIFENQTSDAESTPFKITVPDSVGLNDTDFSAYLEIFTGANGLGGGSLLLKKKCGDDTFRNSEQESTKISDEFPTADTGVLTLAINYKDANEEFTMELTGASSADVSVYGINMNQN